MIKIISYSILVKNQLNIRGIYKKYNGIIYGIQLLGVSWPESHGNIIIKFEDYLLAKILNISQFVNLFTFWRYTLSRLRYPIAIHRKKKYGPFLFVKLV